jgi:hypothetical protein
VEVTDAAPLISPAYDVGAREDETVASWLAHHQGLHPAGG